ncbi:hypothetical protein ACFLZZ_02895 [Nanoarchaeota archaeon]
MVKKRIFQEGANKLFYNFLIILVVAAVILSLNQQFGFGMTGSVVNEAIPITENLAITEEQLELFEEGLEKIAAIRISQELLDPFQRAGPYVGVSEMYSLKLRVFGEDDFQKEEALKIVELLKARREATPLYSKLFRGVKAFGSAFNPFVAFQKESKPYLPYPASEVYITSISKGELLPEPEKEPLREAVAAKPKDPVVVAKRPPIPKGNVNCLDANAVDGTINTNGKKVITKADFKTKQITTCKFGGKEFELPPLMEVKYSEDIQRLAFSSNEIMGFPERRTIEYGEHLLTIPSSTHGKRITFLYLSVKEADELLVGGDTTLDGYHCISNFETESKPTPVSRTEPCEIATVKNGLVLFTGLLSLDKERNAHAIVKKMEGEDPDTNRVLIAGCNQGINKFYKGNAIQICESKGEAVIAAIAKKSSENLKEGGEVNIAFANPDIFFNNKKLAGSSLRVVFKVTNGNIVGITKRGQDDVFVEHKMRRFASKKPGKMEGELEIIIEDAKIIAKHGKVDIQTGEKSFDGGIIFELDTPLLKESLIVT